MKIAWGTAIIFFVLGAFLGGKVLGAVGIGGKSS